MDGIVTWLRSALQTTGLVAGQAARSLRYNWGAGLLSLVLAVSLWVYVTERENPERSGRVPGAVPIEAVNVPPDRAVFPPLEQTVTVRARAPENVFERLSADDFRATVDLAGVTTDRATLNVQVQSSEPRAEVLDVTPSQVTVSLESVTSRTVPVRTELVGAAPRGFETQEITVDPAEAAVTGPESLVARVEAAVADVNLTGVRTNFEQTLILDVRDEGGGSIQGVVIEPESARVRVELVQREFSAVFIVRPDARGVPADGYNVTGIQVDPPFIVISGPAEVFQSIDPVAGIMTEAVSIDGATADVVRTVALRLPEDARVEQPGVTVRISIEPAQGQVSFSVVPRLTNLGVGLSAVLAQPAVQVALGGTVPELSALSPEDITATVDLGGLDAGDHALPVRVQAPSGTTVLSISPPEVQVTLRPP